MHWEIVGPYTHRLKIPGGYLYRYSGHASPGPDRWKERSRFFPGIAEAMADQWGGWAMEMAA